MSTVVALMGMGGKLSQSSFETLLASGFDVRAVFLSQAELHGDYGLIHVNEEVLPEPLRQMAILRQADRLRVPVYFLGDLERPDIKRAILEIDADFICVTGFDRRIPSSMLEAGPTFLNLHPSLLPSHRGSDPLFWAFRHCDPETGVTVHLVDEGLDTGDIVIQRRIDLPDGIRGATVLRQILKEGPPLLVSAIQSLLSGEATPRKQDERIATYESIPSARDMILYPAAISARCAFNFIRGVSSLKSYESVRVEIDGKLLAIEKAISYSDTQHSTSITKLRPNGTVIVRCSPGLLLVQLRIESS